MKKTSKINSRFERGDNQIRTGDQGVADPRLTAWLCRRIKFMQSLASDSDGNRTRVTAVKGRCLDRLTTEPHAVFAFLYLKNSPSRARTYNITVNSRALYH